MGLLGPGPGVHAHMRGHILGVYQLPLETMLEQVGQQRGCSEAFQGIAEWGLGLAVDVLCAGLGQILVVAAAPVYYAPSSGFTFPPGLTRMDASQRAGEALSRHIGTRQFSTYFSASA